MPRWCTVAAIALLLTGCGGDAVSPAQEQVQQRLAALADFHPTAAAEQCASLSITDGTVQVNAEGSRLARVLQTDTVVPPADLALTVQFGSGFPSFTCTDLQSEMHEATVVDTWSATAAGATFTVTPTERCSTATLRLTGVTALAPTGKTVALGDLVITNPAWEWWHPFECRLDS